MTLICGGLIALKLERYIDRKRTLNSKGAHVVLEFCFGAP